MDHADVFVVDQDRWPLASCHPARARRLLHSGKAAVLRHQPFTLILKRTVPAAAPALLRLKLDPGSHTTGFALVDEAHGRVVWAAELAHRGERIKAALLARRQARRARRHRHVRYRQPRFLNRRRPDGWLAPSLAHRVATTLTWVARLRRWRPIGAISVETTRFDTQLLQNPDLAGVDYQRGELWGWEVREYVLERDGRRCAYCGAAGTPLQLDHIVPKSRGGSDRASNLTPACGPCNQAKGDRTAAEFGHPAVQARTRRPLRDATAVTNTRWAIHRALVATGLPVEVGAGGRTKWNRMRLGLAKEHWTDAACVGASTPDRLEPTGIRPLLIQATGHGNRQMCRMDRHGFPRTGPKRGQLVAGFRTGDLVRAMAPAGRRRGVHVGRVVVRASGSFTVQTAGGTRLGVHYRYLRRLQAADGYRYP